MRSLRHRASTVSRVLAAAVLPLVGITHAGLPTRSGPLEVRVRSGLLTVDVREVPLAEVLRAIAAEAGFTLHLDGDLTRRVTRAFADLPVDEGLRRLARGHSVSLAYTPPPGSSGRARLTEVWVIASLPTRPGPTAADLRARAARLQAVHQLGFRRDDGALVELARTVAEDPDPTVRVQATTMLGRFRDPRATAALTTALGDQAPSVRMQAVRGLWQLERHRAADALVRVLQTDPDPGVRRIAAQTLGLIPSEAAGAALRAATGDGDESVRRAAAAALGAWERRRR